MIPNSRFEAEYCVHNHQKIKKKQERKAYFQMLIILKQLEVSKQA